MSASQVKSGQVRLTRRELEVAVLVAQGLTNREIAQRLFLSERTVDGHLEHIREKLGVNNRSQIAAWVVRRDAASAAATAVETRPPAQRRGWSVGRNAWVAAVLLALVVTVAGTLVAQPWNNAPGPIIKTIAGTDSESLYPGGGYSGDGGYATSAQLARPSDVAVAPDGTVYIADQHRMVRRVTGNHIISTVAGTPKGIELGPPSENAVATSVSLGYLSSLAIDSRGMVYMLVIRGGIIEVWAVRPGDSTLTRVVSLGRSAPSHQGYWTMPVGGLAIGKDGSLYIADRAANRVWKYANGEKSPYAGTGEPGIVGDHGAATSARLNWPIGLAIDPRGNLYIADSGNNRIRKVDALGVITTVAGSGKYYEDRGDGGPAVNARLSFPFGVAVRDDGTLFVADTGNNRVRMVTASGRILALAGTHAPGFGGDGGRAAGAGLTGPEAVALKADGRLLIVDTENQRVRELTPIGL
jgi:DNA-binding CsgD family transcriptional regulator/sugar lactone lactonase YvrE